MKTKKDAATAPALEATLAALADTLLAPAEIDVLPALLPPVLDRNGEQYMYFTESDIDRILDNLDGLRSLVFPPVNHDDDAERRVQHFPSVCLIGLGRCGSFADPGDHGQIVLIQGRSYRLPQLRLRAGFHFGWRVVLRGQGVAQRAVLHVCE